MQLPQTIQARYLRRQLSVILPYLPEESPSSLLDFGCGDLSLAQAILKVRPNLHLTGVDVVDFGRRPAGIRFIRYDGLRLPFRDKTFSNILSYHVLHHTGNAPAALGELVRVCRKRLIIIEPTYRWPWEKPLMSQLDFLLNVWKDVRIAYPRQYYSLNFWLTTFRKDRLTVTHQTDISAFPHFLPIGVAYLFVLERR